jgi:hypothetical protein
MDAATPLRHGRSRNRQVPLDTDRVRAPINRRALIARIRRELERRDKGEDLKVARATAAKRLGEFYLVQESKREIVEDHVNLEDLGRRLGVLAAWEFLEKN